MVFSITGTSRLPSNTPVYALPTFTSPDIYVGLSESSVAYVNFFFFSFYCLFTNCFPASKLLLFMSLVFLILVGFHLYKIPLTVGLVEFQKG